MGVPGPFTWPDLLTSLLASAACQKASPSESAKAQPGAAAARTVDQPAKLEFFVMSKCPFGIQVEANVREMKKACSLWAAQEHEREFRWQEGYSIFSVGAYLDDVIDYIARQEEHHRTLTFQDELRGLLERHGMKYDERYLL